MRFVLIVAAVFVGVLLVSIGALQPQQTAATASAPAAAPPTAEQVAAKAEAEEAARKAAAEKEKAASEEAQAYADAKEAMNSVRYSLADPESALFKDVWAVRGQIAGAPPTTFACGTVNAKNGFGGYVGYMPFVAVGSTVMTPGESIFPRVFQQVCLGGKKLFPVQV
jgi:nucleoid-associated protein YgaU